MVVACAYLPAGDYGVTTMTKPIQFGRPLREAHWAFTPGVVNLNHGSYGAAPKVVIDAQSKALHDSMGFPDQYIRERHYGISMAARQELANVLDADIDNLVLCVNATTALNAVIRSYPFARGDKVLKFTTIYGSIDNTLRMMNEKFGLEVAEIRLDYSGEPPSFDEIAGMLAAKLEEDSSIRMAIFDVVTSQPGVRFPFERCVEVCREYGVLSCVDGAHCVGLVDVSLKQVKPDFFTTNAHKWFFSSRSVAALYVDRAHHHLINSLPVSAVYYPASQVLSPEKEKVRLAETFDYVGTADHSAVQAIPTAARFRREVLGGEKEILRYQRELSEKAAAYLCRELGTREVGDYGSEYRTAIFTLLYPEQPPQEDHPVLQNFVERYMVEKWNTHIPVSSYGGVMFIRFSAVAYLDMDDFAYAAKVVKDCLAAWQKRNSKCRVN